MIRPQDVNDNTSIEDMMDVIQYGDPGPWPKGWSGWENTREAHLRILDKLIKNLPELPEGKYSGRGIVSCVSAKSGWSSGKELPQGYFPCAFVQIRELRRQGCKLPVTWCHLGEIEWSPQLTKVVAEYDVKVIDLRRWERETGPWHVLAGWESKIAAIIASEYEECLFLDADNVTLRDPTYLFDEPAYRGNGAVFWPDVPPYNGGRREWIPEIVWQSVGLKYKPDVKAFESGQLLINKKKCWKEVLVTKWINEQSPFFYDMIFGDKDTFCLAWNVIADRVDKSPVKYTMPRDAGWNGGALLQHDFQGKVLFEHCVQNKATLNGYPRDGCLTNPGECNLHLAELRKKWSGKLWENDTPTGIEAEITKSLIGKTFKYNRVGLGEREIRLLEDGRIGKGAAKCEFGWAVMVENGSVKLAVTDVDGQLTMVLDKSDEGLWTGKWQQYERCDVELRQCKE